MLSRGYDVEVVDLVSNSMITVYIDDLRDFVLEDGRIDGMISIGDLNAWDNSSQEMTIHWLEQYIYGQT